MSTNSLGLLGSIAALPVQGRTAKAEQGQQDVARQSVVNAADRSAEKTAGIGEAGGEQQASERDADGRRLWEGPLPEPQDPAAEAADAPVAEEHSPKDPSGDRGSHLDLSG